jgi:hypothetical protein
MRVQICTNFDEDGAKDADSLVSPLAVGFN